MNDLNTKAKMRVLQDLIQELNTRENENLKLKSPKFKKPEVAVVEERFESNPEEEHSEEPLQSLKEKLFAKEDDAAEADVANQSDVDDEDLEKLREMYSRLK